MTVWQQCLAQLRHEYDLQELNNWISPLHVVESTETTRLLAPNVHVLQRVKNEYLTRIQHYFSRMCEQPHKVVLEIGSKSTLTSVDESVTLNQPELKTHHPFSPQATKNSPEANFYFQNGLNCRHLFSNFVEGASNQLARAAALQVCQSPGELYNPLFIYGGSGLGKTHLMHAIGNEILSLKPNTKVLYAYAEWFVNDFVDSVMANKTDQLKAYYRNLDVLLIDDIHFFSGKTRSMEEFFHTFNALFEGHKQIVVTSDRLPTDLEGISPRLRSRFSWGLSAYLEPPEYETRVAILKKKAAEQGLKLPDDVADFVAKHFHSNVRVLEGALMRLTATMRLKRHQEIDLAFAKETLRDQLASQERMVSLTVIKKTVADYYNLNLKEMDSKRRTQSIARPRQIAMALAKELTSMSFPEIGREFGGRDHTTVLHACRKIKDLKRSEARLAEDYKLLTRQLAQ